VTKLLFFCVSFFFIPGHEPDPSSDPPACQSAVHSMNSMYGSMSARGMGPGPSTSKPPPSRSSSLTRPALPAATFARCLATATATRPRAGFFDGMFGPSTPPSPASTPAPPDPATLRILQPFPRDLTAAVRAARTAAKAALDAGATFVEVEMPSASLSSVAGDAEGVNEMNASAALLRDFLREWDRDGPAVRVFFPDQAESRIVQVGRGMNPGAGSAGVAPSFAPGTHTFSIDYLTTPTPLLDMGLDLKKRDAAGAVQATDKLLVAAFPYFNVNEFLAVADLVERAPGGVPLVVFNGEIDRVRSGYYPALFYPKVAAAGERVLPRLKTAFYVHNFKGAGGGTLFRCYPGPWQVLDARGKVVAVCEARPTLKTVALDVLPAAAAAAARRGGL